MWYQCIRSFPDGDCPLLYLYVIDTDGSLEEFLDVRGLDDPHAPYRTSSAEDYVEWGRKRSAGIIKPTNLNMQFIGRNDAMDGLIDHALEVILKDCERNDIVFAHASPGTGKTRLFTELVAMKPDMVERQKQRIKSGQMNQISQNSKALSRVLDNLLPLLVNLNGQLTIDGQDDKQYLDKIGATPDFPIAIRLMFIWLSNAKKFKFFRAKVINLILSGVVGMELFTVENVLELIKDRAGGSYPYLLIDEFAKMTSLTEADSSALVSSLASLQDESESCVIVAFSALKVGLFASASTRSGRPIKAIPLPLISVKNASLIISNFASQEDLNKFPISMKQRGSDDIFYALALFSGGHMRACESILDTVPDHSGTNLFKSFMIQAVTTFSKFQDYYYDMYPAVVLSLYGQSIPGKQNIRLTESDEGTVADLVASGQLMWSFKSKHAHERVLPMIPVISLIGWAVFTKSSDLWGFELARTLDLMINYMFSESLETGKPFERVSLLRLQVMRYVYKALMNDIFVFSRPENVIDWRSASINDLYKSSHFSGPLSEELAVMRFDLTQPLEWSHELLDDPDVVAFVLESHHKKLARVCVPRNNQYPSIDYFYTLKSLDGEMVTVLVQTKWSALSSKTIVNVQNIESVLSKAVENTVKMGVPENRIIAIAELWREVRSSKEELMEDLEAFRNRQSSSTTSRKTLMVPNLIIQVKDNLVEDYGKTLSDFIVLTEFLRTRPSKY